MYPKFANVLRALVAADTDGLWQRWLRATPRGCSDDEGQLLFRAENKLYLSCLLVMYLAPSDDFVRDHTPWVFFSKNNRGTLEQHTSWFRFDEKIRKIRHYPELLSAFEQIVCALLDDLQALPHLSKADISAWMRCEIVITDILIHYGTDNRVALALFNRLRFYADVVECSEDVGAYSSFMYAMSPRSLKYSYCEDHRDWRKLAHVKMQEIVLQESRGVVPQSASCATFGAQYMWSLYLDMELIQTKRGGGQPPLVCIDYEAEVLFVAQLGLFARYGYESYIVDLIATTRSSVTHHALLNNLLLLGDRVGVGWQVENLRLCRKLGMVIEEVSGAFTKDQHAQLTQIYQKMHDRIEHIRQELSRAEQPQDIVKAMKRLKR